MSDARRSRCSTPARALRGGADDHAAAARSPSADGRAGARRRAAVPDAHRAPAPALRPTPRRSGSVELFGERTAVGRLAAPVPVDARLDDRRRRSPAATEVDLPDHVHLRLRGVAARKYLHALGPTARSRSCCCSRARCSPRATPGSGRAGRVARGGVVPAPGRGLARRRWTATSPNSGLASRVSRETLDALTRFKAARALPTGTRRSSSCSRKRASDGAEPVRPRPLRRRPGGRRRRALRGLRALPVPGVGAEEPDPLAVRRAVSRGRSPRPTARSGGANRTECVVDPGARPRLTVRIAVPPGAAPVIERRRRRAGRPRLLTSTASRGCRGTRPSSTRSTCRPVPPAAARRSATHEELVIAAPAARSGEPMRDADGTVVGRPARRREPIDGRRARRRRVGGGHRRAR